MKKFMIFLGLSVVVAFVAFCVMFWFALRQGPSLDTLTRRVCNSLKVAPENLKFLGGRTSREPDVFFELSGTIPENSDIMTLSGWAREDNANLFNELAMTHHIPYVVRDHAKLLNYKGDVFDLYLLKTDNGYCILYSGF